jgi:hypothetical protein
MRKAIVTVFSRNIALDCRFELALGDSSSYNSGSTVMLSAGRSEETMKLAQISDLHLNDFVADSCKIDARKNFEIVLNDARDRGITDIVLTGDLGERASQSWMLDTVASRQMNPSIILGNHDIGNDFETLPFLAHCWKESGLYYSRVLGDFLCIYLDSSPGRINEEQKNG